MNIVIINDLIKRLLLEEGAQNQRVAGFDWIDDQCICENEQDTDKNDLSPVSYHIQRLPKLSDHICSGVITGPSFVLSTEIESGESRTTSEQSAYQNHQLPYSICLNFIHKKQEELMWITNESLPRKGTGTQTFCDLVRSVSRRLLPCPFIIIDEEGSTTSLGNESSKKWYEGPIDQKIDCHPNICIPVCIIETKRWFYAILSATDRKDCVTLWDAAVFRPYVLRDDHDRLLFITYQMVSVIAYCQSRADFLFVDLRLDSVLINVDDFWCRLDVWRNLHHLAKSLRSDTESQLSLGVWCDRWTRGLISNFDYLKILNDFAGRRSGDPYYHPIFPWVCDFTCDTSSVKSDGAGWRDLKKTKFRLTKGDQQLEQMYSGNQSSSGVVSRNAESRFGTTYRSPSISCLTSTIGAHLPAHHVTEFLSDIGYYAYQSRRTPKSILCRHVRRRWVPDEYPASLKRLYEWTPDEAIPELYSDPEMFFSIHPDLPDFELPPWCTGDGTDSALTAGKRFVKWHRAQLESDWVSENLHYWIDLVFGYQLSGQAAANAKNVQLHLVERVDRLSNAGVVQLFTKPHPRRQTKDKSNSPRLSSFDDVLNPLYDLERLEVLNLDNDESERQQTSSQFPVDIWKEIQNSEITQKTRQAIQDCLQNLGVFLAELCHSEVFRQLPKYATSDQRLEVAKRAVTNGQSSPLPRCIRSAVEVLLNLRCTNISNGNSSLSPIDPAIICPELILQPLVHVIPFPYYLAPLYDCFRRIRSLEMDFENLISTNESVNIQSLVVSAENRVRDIAKLLPLILPQTSSTGVELLARLTRKSLFMDPFTRVLAAWSLWNPVAQGLGPVQTEKHLLHCLIDLYDVDTPCSSKFLKLYHRSFLLQLSVRLGMEAFLENFIPPLVEAVAGERDRHFYEDDDVYWKIILDVRNKTMDPVSKRELPNFLLTDGPSRNSVSISENVQVIDRKNDDAQEDPDSLVQFHLDITDENSQNSQRDSVSMDFDSNAAAVEIASIRSSESGFSMGVCGISSSFSLSKNDADDEYNNPKSQQLDQASRLSVSEVAEESLLWLAHRSGPLLTVRYLTKNLLRMLALCYSADRLEPTPLLDDIQSKTSASWYPVLGDEGANKVLHCLEEIAVIYGEHMILRHYFAYASELIAQALKRLTPNMEMAIFACVTLIARMFPYLTHEQLMENLKDHTFIDTLLFPLIRAASSMKVTFSNIASRTTLTWKLAECLYWLGIRVGAENVKTYLFVLVQRLFCTYDLLYELDTNGGRAREICNVGKSGEWSDAAFVQLKATFTPILAFRMLKAFGNLCGRQYLQLSLSNSDLLAKICEDVEGLSVFSNTTEMDTGEAPLYHPRFSSATPDSNRIAGNSNSDVGLVCKRLKHSSRKLKGNWLAYWEYEIGRNPKEPHFNFKHMKLQTFAGHSSSIKKICVLDNENSFFSASQDKTVKLWSLRSTGDGSARTSCQFSYKSHKKPVWDIAFIDAVRLIASVDGTVHLWDPFMGIPIREFEFGDVQMETQSLQQQNQMATIVHSMVAPASTVLVAGTIPVIKFLDVRQARWAHEFVLTNQTGAGPGGPIRSLCVDPSGSDRWVAVGHGLGHVSVLDLRTGRLLGQSRLCETDIFAMNAYDKDQFIVLPFDQPLTLVRANDCTLNFRLPGTSDGVVCMTSFYQELICATQSSRLRFYTSINSQASFSDSKLRADVFSGAITTVRVLPLNKLLLLGSSTGNIELLC